jgi:hypothetical protein
VIAESDYFTSELNNNDVKTQFNIPLQIQAYGNLTKCNDLLSSYLP